jgi:hypothetical protein
LYFRDPAFFCHWGSGGGWCRYGCGQLIVTKGWQRGAFSHHVCAKLVPHGWRTGRGRGNGPRNGSTAHRPQVTIPVVRLDLSLQLKTL